jgi:hypothetical protein
LQIALIEVHDFVPSSVLGQVKSLVRLREQPTEVVPRLPSARPHAEGEAHLLAVGQGYGFVAQVPRDTGPNAQPNKYSRIGLAAGGPRRGLGGAICRGEPAPCSTSSAPEQDGFYGAGEENQVQPYRPVTDVIGVHPDPFCEGRLVAPGHLPRPGNPGWNA